MKPQKNLKELFNKAGLKTKPEMDQKILDDVLHAHEQTITQASAKTQPSIWRTIMKSKITKLTTAAVILIGVMTIIYQFGGSIDGVSVALADVAENVKEVHTFTHREKRVCTFVGEDEPVLQADVFKYCSSEYGVVEEQYNESGELMYQMYLLRGEEAGIMVLPQTKEYLLIPLGEGMMTMLNQLTPKGIVEFFREDEYVNLGRKVIDGVVAEGFEVENPRMLTDFAREVRNLCPIEQSVMRLWVDVETSLPVRGEAELLIGRGFLTCFRRMEMKSVSYDIQLDADFDPAIFNLNIPDDYTLREYPPSSTYTENSDMPVDEQSDQPE